MAQAESAADIFDGFFGGLFGSVATQAAEAGRTIFHHARLNGGEVIGAAAPAAHAVQASGPRQRQGE